MCVLSIKVHIQKKSGNLFNDPRKLGLGYVTDFSNTGARAPTAAKCTSCLLA